MINRHQIPNITYVPTAQRETISIHEVLEKTVMSDKMKLILKSRTQKVESIIDPSYISAHWLSGVSGLYGY